MTGHDDSEDSGTDLATELGPLPLEERMARARAWLIGWVEDDLTDIGFVVAAARAVVGRDAPWGKLVDTVTELYASLVDDDRVVVTDWSFRFHYVDARRLRADLAGMWQRSPEGEVPFGDTPWLRLRVNDTTPPGPP